MIEVIKWVVEDPLHYAAVVGTMTFGIGFIFGRSAKTRPFEIEILKLKGDLSDVLNTIELKSKS